MNNKTKAAMIAHGLFAAALVLTPAAPALAQVMAGGAPTHASRDITDSKDAMAHATTADMPQSSGAIHVMDRVLPP